MTKVKKLTNLNLNIQIEDLHIDEILFSNYSYEQELIKVIVSPDECITARGAADVARYADRTIKIEGLEKLSKPLFRSCQRLASVFGHDGPVTCHLFFAPENSSSFPMHTDPDNVLVHVVMGEKIMALENGEKIDIKAGQSLFIPHDTPHQALNEKHSVMLSFGMERFLLEKMRS